MSEPAKSDSLDNDGTRSVAIRLKKQWSRIAEEYGPRELRYDGEELEQSLSRSLSSLGPAVAADIDRVLDYAEDLEQRVASDDGKVVSLLKIIVVFIVIGFLIGGLGSYAVLKYAVLDPTVANVDEAKATVEQNATDIDDIRETLNRVELAHEQVRTENEILKLKLELEQEKVEFYRQKYELARDNEARPKPNGE